VCAIKFCHFRLVYVANAYRAGAGTVSVIDSITNSVTNTIKVGSRPSDIAVNPNNNLVYVANADYNRVSVSYRHSKGQTIFEYR
jgi:YVTN family beta-propeller protein